MERHERVVHLETPPRPIRVAVACGPALMRAGFRALLEAEGDVVVAGEAASGEQAVQLARRARVDVTLIDQALPGIGALEAIRRITTDRRIQVMVLASAESDYALAALRAGASGVLAEDSEPSELIHAVRVLARGDALLSPSVTRRLLAELTT